MDEAAKYRTSLNTDSRTLTNPCCPFSMRKSLTSALFSGGFKTSFFEATTAKGIFDTAPGPNPLIWVNMLWNDSKTSMGVAPLPPCSREIGSNTNTMPSE